MMAHTCNPRNSGGAGRRIKSTKSFSNSYNEVSPGYLRPFKKRNKNKRAKWRKLLTMYLLSTRNYLGLSCVISHFTPSPEDRVLLYYVALAGLKDII